MSDLPLEFPPQLRALFETLVASLMKVRDTHREALVGMAEELNERLTRAMRKLAKDRYFTQETRVIVAQARVVAEILGAEYGDHIYTVIKQVGHDAATRGRDALVHEIEAWGPEFEGSMRRLVRVHEASDALDPGLLDYYRVSRETYGMEAIDKMHRILALANLGGETVAQTTDKLSQVMALPAWRADRIVRTEQAFALSRRRLLDLRALGEDHLWRKQLIATFDDRTADDSKFVHGQVRRLDEPFIDNQGRHYQHPPNRPNDREVMVFIPVLGARPAPEPEKEEPPTDEGGETANFALHIEQDSTRPELEALDSEVVTALRAAKTLEEAQAAIRGVVHREFNVVWSHDRITEVRGGNATRIPDVPEGQAIVILAGTDATSFTRPAPSESIITFHNHPHGEPPSGADAVAALTPGVAELHVVVPGGAWRITPRYGNRRQDLARTDDLVHEIGSQAHEVQGLRWFEAGQLTSMDFGATVREVEWEVWHRELIRTYEKLWTPDVAAQSGVDIIFVPDD